MSLIGNYIDELSEKHSDEVASLKARVVELEAEVDALKGALGEIAACADWCEDCEPTERKLATHLVMVGLPYFLCDEHAEETRAMHRKTASKGCGDQAEVEEHEQETEHVIALRALGLMPLASASESEEEKKT